jgi:hypothetical protein
MPAVVHVLQWYCRQESEGQKCSIQVEEVFCNLEKIAENSIKGRL